MMTKLIVLILFFVSVNSFADAGLKSCELAFTKLVGGRLPSVATGSNKFNLWDPKFDLDSFLASFKKSTAQEKINFFEDLSKLVHKDKVFNENLVKIVNHTIHEQEVPFRSLKKIFEGKKGDTNFFLSEVNRSISFKIDLDPKKVELIEEFISSSKLSKNYAKEYKDILLSSSRTHDEIEAAIKSGMKLRGNAKDLEQFRNYFEFIEAAKPKEALSALKNIEKIYNYEYKPSILRPGILKSEPEKFLTLQDKVKKYETKRFNEILDEMRIEESRKLVDEISELNKLKSLGKSVDEKHLKALRAELKAKELKSSLKKRAQEQARGEAKIFKQLKTGCNSGTGNKKLDAAKKKFKRFKFALSLGGTPFFYYMKNKDKMDSDPFWFEKLGYEMGMGLVFTFVGNKIVTGTNTSFWTKYLQGYGYGALLDLPNAAGYDLLFGKKGYGKFIKKVYSGEDVESEVEKEYKHLMESPEFEREIKELFTLLEEQSKKANTKNFLDKYLNLSVYDSSLDPEKITQEDLETEEGREMMLELLSERMYLQNMGDWPVFQTGNKGADRWGFYRMTNLPLGIKSLLLDLTIFRILCNEPLGTVGSFGLAMGIVLTDKYFFSDLTYGLRRDAINQ